MTTRRTRLFVFPLALAAGVLAFAPGSGGQAASGQREDGQITVAAAISMKDALEALKEKFEEHADAPRLAYTFGASGILEKQIEAGAPVDVFLSAAPTQMKELEAKRLLAPGTRRNVAGNRLVLVVAPGWKAVKGVEDLRKGEVRIIAIGETRSVPAGQYAAEALRNLGLFEALERKFVYAQNVRAVLTYVADREAEVGFVYETDAKTTDKVEIAARVPASSYTPVVYSAAVVRGSPRVAGAKKFLDFLGTAEARAVFEKYGFSAAD